MIVLNIYLIYRLFLKHDKDTLVVGQSNYATKIVNAYMVYELDRWSKIPFNNFKFKNCFFANTVKKSGKEKYVYSGYGIAYDGVDSQSFGKDFPRNVVIFGLHNSSSSQADNFRNNFQCQIKDIVWY